MTQQARHIWIEDLIGSKIVTAEGKAIGRVVDCTLTAPPEYRVKGLLFGRYAWLYRLHVLHPFAEKLGLSVTPREVPWEAVADYAAYTVTLKPGHERDQPEDFPPANHPPSPGAGA
jgi:hypothetical protein